MQLGVTPAKLTADHTAKGASMEFISPIMKTTCKSTNTVVITATKILAQYDDWKSSSEWTLSVP